MPIQLLPIISASFLLFIIGIYYFINYKDEIPAYISLLNLCFLWRFIAIEIGIGQWAIFPYGIPLEFNSNIGIEAFWYILIGMYLIVCTYCWNREFTLKPLATDNFYFRSFLAYRKNLIIFGLFASLLITYGLRGLGGGGGSYGFLFPFFRASMIVLGGLVFFHGRLGFLNRVVLFILVSANISTTLVSGGRFVLIAWGIIFILFVAEKFGQEQKGLFYLLSGSGFLLLFSALGIRRYESNASLDILSLYQQMLSGLLQFSDFNMIDGLVMLVQVYPRYLDYSYGMGHLEILLRPIPRSLWPDKAVGGWQQKLAIVQAQGSYGADASPDLFNTGISPTIFGDFYSEGGLIGILVFSIIYGLLFAKVINFSCKFSSDCQILIKGMLISSMFPLIRGGDIPGIAAFILLAYWPLIIVIFLYSRRINEFLKQKQFLK